MFNGVSLLVNSYYKYRIGRGFYISLWPATIISSTENHGECPGMPPRRLPDRIFTVPRLCSACIGTSSERCIMSCWNRVKSSQGISIERNWYVWAEHWRRNGHNIKRDTTKLSSSMTMLGHMLQDWSRHTWKRWNGRSYPTRRTLQMLLLPTTICFDWW